MITINEKLYEWFEHITVSNMLSTMGYTLKKPAVLIKINNKVIKKSEWENFFISDNAVITVVNLLRGG